MKRWSVAVLAVAVIGFLGALAWFALAVPDRVPMHSNAAGEADRWGSKSAALAVLGVTGGALAAISR
ncbi:DUF1648 domain-containing protein [Nocardia vinacea]|uniref:DUF1648 domain-containing protein n=1 Tax=Nocardia vinacea TaxID=96468 RepID=UPI00341BDBD2